MRFLSIILLQFITVLCISQTTTIPINSKAYHLNDTVSIDLNQDSNIDLYVYRWFGIDAMFCSGTTLNSNSKLTSPVTFGNPFTFFSSLNSIYLATIGCYWSTFWTPNTGLKYMGTYYVNNPGDTTFGYLTMEFIDPSNSLCEDTLVIHSYTFANQSNTTLTAGDVITGLTETNKKEAMEVFPTVSNGFVNLINHSSLSDKITLFNSIGQITRMFKMQGNSRLNLDISEINEGLYYLHSNLSNQVTKIIKL